jgi:hypothetical protein
MSDYIQEEIFTEDQQKINTLVASGEIQPLEDICLVESLALSIQELEKKVEFYGAYKKKKIEQISKEVASTEARIDFLKQLILATLKENGEKSIKFPGSCSISTRNGMRKWIIEDEDEFITWVKTAKEKGEKVDGVLEVVEHTNVIKKVANKLLDAWDSSGKLEELTKKMPNSDYPVVTKEDPTPIVVIKYEQEEEILDEPQASDEPITKKYDTV